MNKKLICSGIILAIFSFNTNAKEIKAKGDVSFEGGVFSNEPDIETKQKAVNIAVINAWKKYTSEFSAAKLNAYKQSQSYFESNLDEFVIEKKVLEQEFDQNTNTYSVVAKVNFNDIAVDSKLNDGNPKAVLGAGAVGSKSLFSFLFLAREQSSIKAFDARKTVKAKVDTNSENDRSQDLNITNTGGQKKLKESTSDEITVTTGGSTLKKANETEYRVYSSGDIDAASSEVLSSNNFEVVSFSEITAQCNGPSLDKIKSEFVGHDEMSPETRVQAVRAAKSCDPNLRYFAVGTLDARMTDVDPASGNTRTSVSFRGQVWDITSGLSRVVASIGPIQKFGLGPDASSATSVALREAATEASTEIVNQLNARNLK
jgi:hypothetical protein